jgi:hypothetical protein
MNLRKVIHRRIRSARKGVNAAGDVNAVISVNTSEPGSTSHVSSRQRTRIVQRGGRTEVYEHESDSSSGEGRKR